MSLRRRLLLGILAVAAVLVAANVLLTSALQGYLLARVDQQLADLAERPALRPERQGGPGSPEPLTELFLGFVDLGTGHLVRFGSALGADDPPAVTAEQLQASATPAGGRIDPFTVSSVDGGRTWRVAAVERRLPRPVVLVVGVDLSDVEATLARMRLVQLLSSLAVLAALAAVAWWVIRLGIRPLVAMAGTADAIAAGDLGRRVEQVDERTEAGRLGHAFNEMLARLEEAFRQRSQSEARVRRFAADASHELRTPLTSIRGYAELWQAGGLRDPEQLGEAMRRMGDEARRMGALVEDLLLLARLDQDRPLERAPVRLDLLAADGASDLRALQPERPVATHLEPAVVAGDEHALRQIVANLLANARTHTPADAAVTVAVAARDGRVRLEVADQGPGMDPETASRAFERFYRADPARTRRSRSGGSGLGLSIVRSVAEAHGGRAWVETSPGAGSRFVVELPTDATAGPAGIDGAAVPGPAGS